MSAVRGKNPPSQSTFGDRVEVQSKESGSYLILSAPIKDVVSFQGSFLSIPDYENGEELVRDLTVSMLDKGTQSRSKLELAEAIEGIGAQISFSTDGIRVHVSGRALSRDISFVLALLGEQLREPSFPEKEFELLKGRYEAAFLRSLTSTSTMSSSVLSRHIYEPGNPNYAPDARLEIERLRDISVDAVKSYYEGIQTGRDWTLSIVGDTTWNELSSALSDEFRPATSDGTADLPKWPVLFVAPGREEFHIPDKDNIDVRFGHTVDMTSIDEAFVPLYLGNYILGGNFSARLMSVIRDEMGLTYGIHSSLSDMDRWHHGMWEISVTLGSNLLEKGIQETLSMIRRFTENGVTQDELEEKQSTIVGGFKVGLSSTRSLAGALLRNAEKGRDPGYLDCFSDIVLDTTLDEVNDRISQHLDPDRLHLTLAGSLSSVDQNAGASSNS